MYRCFWHIKTIYGFSFFCIRASPWNLYILLVWFGKRFSFTVGRILIAFATLKKGHSNTNNVRQRRIQVFGAFHFVKRIKNISLIILFFLYFFAPKVQRTPYHIQSGWCIVRIYIELLKLICHDDEKQICHFISSTSSLVRPVVLTIKFGTTKFCVYLFSSLLSEMTNDKIWIIIEVSAPREYECGNILYFLLFCSA